MTKEDLGVAPSARGRSAALRAEPATQSQAKPAATNARLCTVPPEGWRCSREAGHEGPCAARPCRYPVTQGEHGRITYGPWSIRYDPKPIPTSACDWNFEHENHDASWEGEEDGWVGNGLCGTAGSLAGAIVECDAIEDEGDESCHPASGDAQ